MLVSLCCSAELELVTSGVNNGCSVEVNGNAGYRHMLDDRRIAASVKV